MNKQMYAVEHYYPIDDSSTFEIFETLSQAEKFCDKENWSKHNYPIFIFYAEFNSKRIYQENQDWNYDDKSDTIVKYLKYYKDLKYTF